MSNTSTKTVKGRVTGSLFGVCTNISYDDGCQRPGDIGLEVGSIVASEAEVVNGICEHLDVRVVHTATPIAKPKPVSQPKAQQPKAITVQDILAVHEKPKRLPLPESDAPVSVEVINKAKVPPPIRRNPNTAPLRDTTAVPVENAFDGDITGLTLEEIAELRGGPSAEPISTDKPMNPFSEGFDASRPPKLGPKRGSGPISVFDLK